MVRYCWLHQRCTRRSFLLYGFTQIFTTYGRLFLLFTECTEIFILFYYPIAEGDEGEACDEAEEDVGDESADIAVLEHL